MIPISICIFAAMASGCLCFLLGSYLSYQRGSGDGFDEGYAFATSELEIAWRITAQGETARDAGRAQAAPVELSIHPSHLQLPLQ